MKIKELIGLLSPFDDEMEIKINHPEGDWLMDISSLDQFEDSPYLIIQTDFSED